MAFVIGLLTFLIVLDSLVLVLLVLIQLPKKEAGVGVAFGGAATDALFGAGSGNVLTKTTKYAAGIFFALSMVLSVLQSRFYHQSSAEFRRELERQAQQAPVPTPSAPSQEAAAAPATTTGTNWLAPLMNLTNAPNAPAAATGTTTGMNLLMPAANVTNAPPAPPPK